VPFAVWWRLLAKPWLKKHWYLVVLFPVGLVVLFLRLRRQPPAVVAPEVVGAAEVQREAAEERDKEVAAAAADRDQAHDQVIGAHSQRVREYEEGQRAQLEQLRKDPSVRNRFLKGVGDDMRGRSKR